MTLSHYVSNSKPRKSSLGYYKIISVNRQDLLLTHVFLLIPKRSIFRVYKYIIIPYISQENNYETDFKAEFNLPTNNFRVND